MKVGIQCPKCQKRYQVAGEAIGKRVKCAQCATAFVAEPSAAAPAAKPAAPGAKPAEPATGGPIAARSQPAAAPARSQPAAAPARPKPAAAAARPAPARPAAVPAPAPSLLDDLFAESFAPTAGGTSLPAHAAPLAGGTALSSGPSLAIRPAPKRKLAIQRGTFVVVLVIGVASAAGLFGAIMVLPYVRSAVNTWTSPLPTDPQPDGTSGGSNALPPSNPTFAQPSAAPSAAPPGQSSPSTVAVNMPANVPTQPTEYENNCREALASLRQLADLMASIHDRPSAQAVIDKIIPLDKRYNELYRKITLAETLHKRTPRDLQIARELSPDIQAQVARVNGEADRLRDLAVKLRMQDMLDRVSARRSFGPSPAQPPPSATNAAKQPAAPGPHTHVPHVPPHRLHKP